MADVYQIQVKGHLDPHWADWFDALTFTNKGDGTTVFSSRVVDQAALHALLMKVRDRGVVLLCVVRVEIEK
jgi:hypothetical protein